MFEILVNKSNIRGFSIRTVREDAACETAAAALTKYLQPASSSDPGELLIGFAEDFSRFSERVKTMTEESVAIAVSGRTVVIAGGGPRGVVYAAYEFLERFCGWRFFTGDTETAPEGTVTILDGEYVFTPRFDKRMILMRSYWNHDLIQKRHINSVWGSAPLPEDLGSSIYYAANNAHTMRDLLPAEEFFDAHPEYFAMNESGERVRNDREGTSPCLTNPDVFDIVLDRAKRILRGNPHAKFISISQNDGWDYCRCPACSRVNEEEQTNGGTIFRFVNRIARAVREEFPNVLVDTLPYNYSTKPPVKTMLEDNVSIHLCLMETCREHSILDESCPYNQKVRDYFKGWAAVCKNIYLWDYAANFKVYPVCIPNFKLLYQNMQEYIRFPVKGIMYQDAHTTDPDIEFGQLWGYLQAKLLWEPEADYATYLGWTKAFMKAYYGDGWEYLYDYLFLLAQQPSSDYHYGPYATCEQLIPMLTKADGTPDTGFIRDANALFDLAEKKSKGVQLEHVLRTRLHVLYYELCTTYDHIRKNGTEEEISALREKYQFFHAAVFGWEHFQTREGGPSLYHSEFDFDKHPAD